jgi:hypothetical protein
MDVLNSMMVFTVASVTCFVGREIKDVSNFTVNGWFKSVKRELVLLSVITGWFSYY